MFCSKCGNQVNDNEIFCHNCGNKVVGTSSQSNSYPTTNNFSYDNAKKVLNSSSTGLFNNSGKKVKTLAIVLFVLCIIGCLILGILTISGGVAMNKLLKDLGTASIIEGVLTIIFGIILAFLCSLVYYAVGEAAEKSSNCEKMLSEMIETDEKKATQNTADEIKILNEEFKQGKLTQEEYQAKRAILINKL